MPRSALKPIQKKSGGRRTKTKITHLFMPDPKDI
jgi:hypothetical protein